MSDNAEEGIARAQVQGNKSDAAQQQFLKDQQALSASNFNDRIVTFVLTLGLFGLVIVWMTAKSDLVIYGSFVAVLVLIVVMGIVKIKRIDRIREARQRQASEWNAQD